MKRLLQNSLLIFLTGVLLPACEEVGPLINTGGGGNTGGGAPVDSSQEKVVLLEVFTATNCPNCPAGREIAENLEASYPGRIELIEIHQGVLSQQLDPDDPILKTEDGEDLAAYLGPPPFWPCGAVDRINFEVAPQTFIRLLDRGLWPTYVPQQMNEPLKILLGMEVAFDTLNRTLEGRVTLNFLETISGPINLTVLIKEDGITATQLDKTIEIPDYIHDDVLRDVITTVTGDAVGGTKTAGSAWTYSISAAYPPLPEEWQASRCKVVAFVSQAVAPDYNVLQVIQAPLLP